MPIDRAALLAGVLALGVAGCLALANLATLASVREAALDTGLSWTAKAPSGQVIVVAIDEAALQSMGRWPWPRARLARVLGDIAAAKPAVLGVDLVLSGDDPAGAAALSDLASAAALAALPDGDAALQSALTIAPIVLGAALTNHPAPVPRLAPLLAAGPAVATTPWFAEGIEAPTALQAAGLGITSFQGQSGGRVRSAPLLVLAGEAAVPGFAAEVMRLFAFATAFRLGGGVLSVGDVMLPLGATADLRIRPSDPAKWAGRTIPLAHVQNGDAAMIAGKIVLLGLTAPQAAAFRPTAVTPLAPSVQIQADAIETMLSGKLLVRPGAAGLVEGGAALILAVLAIAAAAMCRPRIASALIALLAAGWVGATSLSWLVAGLAMDPVAPAVICLICGGAAVLAGMRAARARAAALRRRFERHLSPALVARIAAQPGLMRLPGEAREVTVIFTDLQAFSTHAATMEPAELIAVLDRYFSRLTALVYAHGGMIDKFVGDAAHILFNAPFDLPDHHHRAVECALAIRQFGEDFTKDPANLGLGITRVGLESGQVIVGDVGSAEKLDYTAHGRAMNLAARLEQAGKPLGVRLVAGPDLRAATPDLPWQPLGQTDLRSFGSMSLWTL